MSAAQLAPKPSEQAYLNCIRCGACLPVCPTYREHLHETASPRGRVALARKELEDDLSCTSGLRHEMEACFGCMACDVACPVGIRPSGLARDMRFWHESIAPARWKDLLFGQALVRPPLMELATGPLRLVEKAGVRRLAAASSAFRRLPPRLRDMDAMLPPWPPRPLRQVLPTLSAARSQERYRVGFFLGCAQSLLFAAQSAATVRVLNRNGCTVLTPRDTVCCGLPASAYGRADLARQQAVRNIRAFDALNVDVILTDCATCGSALKDYGALLAGDPAWADRAQQFSRRVQDISEFLMSIRLRRPHNPRELRVTYHDPCHLRRGQGIWQQPRELLRLVDGLDLVELPEADWCCGSAGSQLLTHYDTSGRVLDRKMRHLASTGAQVVASGCPACRMQLRVGLRRSGASMQVVHPVQLLDSAYES